MIDTHTHLFVEEFAEDLPQVIERARLTGVERTFLPNIDDTTVQPLLDVCAKYPGYCFPMLGFHPTSVDATALPKVQAMKSLLVDGHPFVGIGEVGLDLYWDKTFHLEQEDALRQQITWALEYDLPIIIHSREAFTELYELFSKYKDTPLRGVFHSFTGTADEAKALLEFPGFVLGINGVATFKKSTLPKALQEVPLSRLVVETDSPYLAPVPYRGKRNESTYVARVAEKLAEVYQRSAEEVAQQTYDTAYNLFFAR